jgi:hypothetical protein
MRELLLPPLEVLVAHHSIEMSRIDVKQHEILPSAKPLVGDPDHLVSVGTMNESFRRQRVSAE